MGTPRLKAGRFVLECVVLGSLAAAPPCEADPAASAPPVCGPIGRPAEVSLRGQERRLLERMEAIVRSERGSTPSPADVAAAFHACRAQLTARRAATDGEDGPLAESVLSGWQLWPDSSRLHLEVAGREACSFPLSESAPRLAARIVPRLVRELGLRDEAARIARRTLWFLWFEGYVAALGHRHDHYTYADELARERAADRGKSFSIGVELAVEAGLVTIREVLDPVLVVQGVRAGEALLALDGRAPESLTGTDWDRYLLNRDPFDYTLTSTSVRRARSRAVPSRHRSLVWGRLGRAVYVRILRFSRETEIELRRVLRGVAREETSELILDLRQDPGGAVCPGLVDFFLKPGQTTVTWKRLRSEELRHEPATVEYYDLPLVVLVDAKTASMAELLAAAVKQHRRGVLVGQRTLGKAEGQKLFPVLDEGELALVRNLYYYPGTAETWNETGILPDVEVPPAGEELVELLRSPVLDLERQLALDAALNAALSRQEEKR